MANDKFIMVGDMVVALFIFFIVLPIAIIVIMGLFGISLVGLIVFLKETTYIYKNKWFWITIGAIFLIWRLQLDGLSIMNLLLFLGACWLIIKLYKKYKELLRD